MAVSTRLRIRDASWIQQAFLVAASNLDVIDQENRFFTTASLKFSDTRPGGSIPINPPPQFTRFADIRPPNIYAANVGSSNFGIGSSSLGLGRWYSEAIDDHSQVIHIRAGVPAFNSLTTFFSGFYNSDAGTMARTGRAPSFLFNLAKTATFVVSIMSWKLVAVNLIGNGLSFFMKKPSSKFYYLKPAMPMYWSAVQTMVNQIATNMGITPRALSDDPQDILNDKYQFTSAAAADLERQLPDIFRGSEGSGRINVYAIATKAQRLARAQEAYWSQIADSGNSDLNSMISQFYSGQPLITRSTGYANYLQDWFNSSIGTAPSSGDVNTNLGAATTQAGNNTTGTTTGSTAPTDPNSTAAADSVTESLVALKNQQNQNGVADFLKAEFDDGGAWVSFRVNSTGQIQESFSSSVAESEMMSKINEQSSSARSTTFDFAGGNIVGGTLGKMIGSVMKGVEDTISGVAAGLNLSGLAALGGSAFVDIPKHWQNSSVQMPRMNYTINLVSPYGNPFSQLFNLYIPLCMLLALAMPLSTGKQSYTSPFLVEVYDKGRAQTRLGIIDSMSITRGTGNTGFSQDGHVMGIEVSFSIMELTNMLHMPITQGFSNSATVLGTEIGGVVGGLAGASGGPAGIIAGAAGGATVGAAGGAVIDAAQNALTSLSQLFDDDNAFVDYMAVLGSMGLQDQIYQFKRFKLNLTNVMSQWSTWYSIPHYASMVGDSIPGRLMGVFYRGTVRN